MKTTYVYKITRIDGMAYIGITVNIKARFYSHKNGDRFKIGIDKYEILDICDSYEEAEKLETLYINEHDTYINGLNLTEDGKGTNKECSFNTLGHVYSEESRNKMSVSAKKRGYHGPRYHTEDTKKRLSELRRGKCWSPRKITEEQAIQIFEDYENFDISTIDLKPYVKKTQKDLVGKIPINELKRASGHSLSKIQIFCDIQHNKYNVTKNQIRNIIKKQGNMAPTYD